jgi:hypothetical protein
MDYLQMEEAGDMLTLFFFQLQRNIENPIIHFRNIVGKIASYCLAFPGKLGYFGRYRGRHWPIADTVSRRWLGNEIDWLRFSNATTFGWVQLALIAVALVVIRRIVIRLNMPDTRLNPDR